MRATLCGLGILVVFLACQERTAIDSPGLEPTTWAPGSGGQATGSGGAVSSTSSQATGSGGRASGTGGQTVACANGDFCSCQPPVGLLVCDDFSTPTPPAPREFVLWNNMPSLAMSVSDGELVFERPNGFSACYAKLGDEMDFRDTSIEVTMTSQTKVRSLSSVSWGTPQNLINAGLQRDEQALYLHFVVNDVVRARLWAGVPTAPGQSQRVRMEIRASGSIRCFVDDKLVLETTQDVSALPRTLAPGVATNSYPPEQRFVFDDFVVRRLTPVEPPPPSIP